MRTVALSILALALLGPAAGAAEPIPRRWTSLDLSDVDPSPFRWAGPCEVQPPAGTRTICRSMLDDRLALLLLWAESESGDCRKRRCADGQFRIFQENPYPDQLFQPGWGMASKRYAVTATVLGFDDRDVNEEVVLRRILPQLIRLVEPYAVPCGCPEDRPGVPTPPLPLPPPSNEPIELPPPGSVEEADPRAGYDAEGGVFGQSDTWEPGEAVGSGSREPDEAVESSSPEADITFGAGSEAFDAGDFERSLSLMTEAAEMGDPRAPGYVGNQYHMGKGTAPDGAKALRYYRMGAERKDGFATHQLGLAYEHGRFGLGKDDRAALRHYERAAEQGWSAAARVAGLSHQQGFGGVEPSERKALDYYIQAADLGNMQALNDLGIFYQEGRGGLTPDPEVAATYFRKAADLGYDRAMNNLARGYRLGLGVPVDRGQAMDWYRKASELGNENATDALTKMEAGEW